MQEAVLVDIPSMLQPLEHRNRMPTGATGGTEHACRVYAGLNKTPTRALPTKPASLPARFGTRERVTRSLSRQYLSSTQECRPLQRRSYRHPTNLDSMVEAINTLRADARVGRGDHLDVEAETCRHPSAPRNRQQQQSTTLTFPGPGAAVLFAREAMGPVSASLWGKKDGDGGQTAK